MTDDNAAAPGPAPQEVGQPQVHIMAQYIKDLSFENPDAANALRAGQPAPSIDMGIDVQARKAPNDAFEVDLNINARALRGDAVAFLCELTYTGVFRFSGIPAEALEPLLLVEAPRMLFPFARRIVADATRDGGFPPLYVDPIDFASLYQKQRAQQAGAAAPAAAAEEPATQA